MDGEKITRIAEAADQVDLVRDLCAGLLGNAAWPARLRAGPGEGLELRLRRAADRHRLVGIFVAQLVEREAATLRDLEAGRDRFGIALEQARHLGRRLQMPLAMRKQTISGLVERDFLADADEHVLQRASCRDVMMHVVGREELHLGSARDGGEMGKTR